MKRKQDEHPDAPKRKVQKCTTETNITSLTTDIIYYILDFIKKDKLDVLYAALLRLTCTHFRDMITPHNMVPYFNMQELFPTFHGYGDCFSHIIWKLREQPKGKGWWSFMAVYANDRIILDYTISELKSQLMDHTIFLAIAKGDMDMFRKIETIPDDGHVRVDRMVEIAAFYGRMDVLTFIKEKYNKGFNLKGCYAAITGGREDCYKYILRHSRTTFSIFTYFAASSNRPEFFRIASTYRDDVKNSALLLAKEGNVEALRLMKESGLEITGDLILQASKSGNLECLLFAYQICEPSPDVDTSCISEAAAAGSVECVKFLHDNGYKIKKDACEKAASKGHLDCLMYLRDQGAEWGRTLDAAVQMGHLECVKYAIENGCKRVYWALWTDHNDVIEYLTEKGIDVKFDKNKIPVI